MKTNNFINYKKTPIIDKISYNKAPNFNELNENQNNSLVALVCIAKNEDNYIEEWINYYTKLGIDHIYIYTNDWTPKKPLNQLYNNVTLVSFNGKYRQLKAYNHFIENYAKNYGFAAFFDVDEYLSLKKYNNIKDWLKLYYKYNAIGVNWRLFGDNNLKNVVNDDYSIVNRFTKASKTLNRHIKTILNINKCDLSQIRFTNDPHHVNYASRYDFTINTLRTDYIHGPWNDNFNDPDVQLNHYFCKTIEEFKNIKITNGNAACSTIKTLLMFDEHNTNEIEDLTAYNFINNN